MAKKKAKAKRLGWGWKSNKTRRLVAKDASLATWYGMGSNTWCLAMTFKGAAELHREYGEHLVRVEIREV